jgi:hypothetical protein
MTAKCKNKDNGRFACPLDPEGVSLERGPEEPEFRVFAQQLMKQKKVRLVQRWSYTPLDVLECMETKELFPLSAENSILVLNTVPIERGVAIPAETLAKVLDKQRSALFTEEHLKSFETTPMAITTHAEKKCVDEATVAIHCHGTTNPDLARATFRPAWNNPTGDTLALRPTQPRGHSPWLGALDTEDLHEVIIASNLSLTSGLRLKKESATILFHLREQLFVH